MVDFLADNFSNCVFVAVFLLALCPMLESKIAIPFALSTVIWGEATLSPVATFFLSFFGSMLPAIFVIWLSRWIKNKTSGFVHEKFLSSIQGKFQRKFDKVNSKKSTFAKCLSVATFVAVPLPLTGVYTGSLIAGLTSLKTWQAFISVLLGEVVSCGVIMLLCLVFENSAFYILLASLILLTLFVVINLFVWMVKKVATLAEKNKNEI